MRLPRGVVCFNPRLARAGEATAPDCGARQLCLVSIRASPVRARRPMFRGWPARLWGVSIRASPVRARRPSGYNKRTAPVRFQSAPRPCGRGDFAQEAMRRGLGRFQSAPRPCGRGDRPATPSSTPSAMFQSAPRPCGRGDEGGLGHGILPAGVSIRASPVRARRQMP